MTPEQYAMYSAALQIGRAFGVGGNTWTYYAPPSEDGINQEPTLGTGISITGYVVQEKLAQYGMPLPQQPIAAFRWRFNAPVGTDVEAGGVITNGTLAFSFSSIDQYQGWPTGILEIASVPDRTITPATLIAAFQAGLRIGAY